MLWQRGNVIDLLGTLGGNNAIAISIKSRGQVVGGAAEYDTRFVWILLAAFYSFLSHAGARIQVA